MSQYKYPVKTGFKWMVKFSYIDPISGETKTKYTRGFASKREAKQFEEDFLENLTIPEEEEEEIIKTFGDVFQEYLASHKRSDIKESTLETKFNIFNKHIFPYFEDMPITDINDDVIAEWQMEIKNKTLQNGKPFSQAYLRTIQCQFNSIINYAKDKGYLSQNPLVDIKNMGAKGIRVQFWTLEQYEKFAYHAMNYPRYYYAYEILYWCGLRVGELLALTLKDIDFEDGTISITKTYHFMDGQDVLTSPKTPSSNRKVSMPAFLIDEIKEYVDMIYKPKDDERLFQFRRTQLNKNLEYLIEQHGLKKITIHGLRHSHVSLLISKKYDIFEVSKRIGHKSIVTTQNIYGHLFDGVQRTIANDLDQMRKRG